MANHNLLSDIHPFFPSIAHELNIILPELTISCHRSIGNPVVCNGLLVSSGVGAFFDSLVKTRAMDACYDVCPR